MRLTKNQLKELIKKSIDELDFKSQDAFDAYNKKHKMRKTTKVNIAGKDTTAGDAKKKGTDKGEEQTFNVFVNGHDKPMKIKAKDEKSARHQAHQQIQNPNVKVTAEPAGVGGPSHANVPKGAKSSSDVEKTAMGAADDANKKMDAALNKDIDKVTGYINSNNFSPEDLDPIIKQLKAAGKDTEELENFKMDIGYEMEDGNWEGVGDQLGYLRDALSSYKSGKKESVRESKMRRFTVKEVRTWMKTLEENRYKKVYNSDARRVSWMVNNIGENLENMPKSMRKKWTKAQYGRERYLAKEFLKSKKQQMTEQRVREFVRKRIGILFDAKMVQLQIPMRDRKKVDKILKKSRGKEGKDFDYGVGRGSTFMLELDKKFQDRVIELLIKNRIQVKEV